MNFIFVLKKWAILFIVTMCATTVFAQSHPDPHSLYAFTGASVRLSAKTHLFAYYAFNRKLDQQLIYIHAPVKLNQFITIDPVYLYLMLPGVNGAKINEHDFLNDIDVSIPLKTFVINDRNMLWDRIRKDAADLHYYRNRLKISLPLKINTKEICILYVYNEGFYNFTYGLWSRNRVAAGIIGNIKKGLNIDFSYVRQNDHYIGDMNIFFLFLTVKLENFGVFKSKDSNHNK